MRDWKNRERQEAEAEESPQREHIITVQKNDAWIGWKPDGSLDLSEGYDMDPVTMELLSMLGPVLKEYVRRSQPPVTNRKKFYQQQVEIGNGEEEEQ